MGDQPSYRLNFDGATLTFHGPDGRIVHRFDAVSGRPGSHEEDQSKAWYGPIPEGSYSFEPSEFVENWPLGDWGTHHVSLEADDYTITFGRDGFHIHGGLARGSAGCIDLGPRVADFYELLRQIDGPVSLTVLYDNPNAFNWDEDSDVSWSPPAGIPVWSDWVRSDDLVLEPLDTKPGIPNDDGSGISLPNDQPTDDNDAAYGISLPEDSAAAPSNDDEGICLPEDAPRAPDYGTSGPSDPDWQPSIQDVEGSESHRNHEDPFDGSV